MKNDNLKEQYRINERIRVREVRLVGDNIETGVYPIAQALKIAEEQGMDLVEISPNAAPPVCRVIDYQKFLYQQKKRQKEQKAKSVKVVVKEIRFGPQTDDHDYNFKLKHAKGFLEEGSKVKAYVFFKGSPAASFCQRFGRLWKSRAVAGIGGKTYDYHAYSEESGHWFSPGCGRSSESCKESDHDP